MYIDVQHKTNGSAEFSINSISPKQLILLKEALVHFNNTAELELEDHITIGKLSDVATKEINSFLQQRSHV